MIQWINLKAVGVQELNAQLAARPVAKQQFAEWVQELNSVNAEFPLTYPKRDDVIMPQWAIEVRVKSIVLD